MKPYQRGRFRVVATTVTCATKFTFYDVQVQSYRGTKDWVTFESFDCAANARLRVRNLHAASCIHADLTKPKQWDAAKHDLTGAAKYFKAPKSKS